MLTGQAGGTIAALAVKQGVQPRALDVVQVQRVLLDSGCTLIQRWYADVPWGTPVWRATQLLALHQIMDRPGAIEQDSRIPLATQAVWGVNEPLERDELRAVITRLAERWGLSSTKLCLPAEPNVSSADLDAALKSIDETWGNFAHVEDFPDPVKVTAGQFALIASLILLHGITK
jgi:hypothetical protein